MITIFNGKKRALGQGGTHSVFVQVDVDLRDHLHLLKGARLAVLLAIALHADEDGWAWPSYETLKRETGYGEGTIKKALADLCALEIDGQRVLLRYQPTGEGGKFESNRYLIFPSAEEVQRYEGAGVTHLGAEAANRGTKSVPRSTVVQKTVGGKVYDEQEPIYGDYKNHNQLGGGKENTAKNSIAVHLRGLGIFPEPAEEIAAAMVEAGLTPDEAEEIFWETMQVTGGNIAQTVYRLRRGIWDAGEIAEGATRKARYDSSVPAPADAPPEEPERPEDQIWRAVLDELQLETTRATFNTWLRDTRLVACEDGVFVIGVRNGYAKDWLENRLASTIRRILSRHAGREVEVRFVVEEPNAD